MAINGFGFSAGLAFGVALKSDGSIILSGFVSDGLGPRFTLVAKYQGGSVSPTPSPTPMPATGTITAHKFQDDNGDGLQGAGEGLLQGWEMTLYNGTDCTTSSGRPAQLTGANGDAKFENLAAGSYSVKETLKPHWVNPSDPDLCKPASVLAGQTATVNFGNKPLPDLTVSKSAGQDPVSVNTTLAYRIVVTNQGAATANGVVLQDTLPGDVHFDLAQSAPNCSQSGRVITCSLGDMAAGRFVITQLYVDVLGPPGRALTNTAVVDASNTIRESDETNNAASVLTNVALPGQNPPPPIPCVGVAVDNSLGSGVTEGEVLAPGCTTQLRVANKTHLWVEFTVRTSNQVQLVPTRQLQNLAGLFAVIPPSNALWEPIIGNPAVIFNAEFLSGNRRQASFLVNTLTPKALTLDLFDIAVASLPLTLGTSALYDAILASNTLINDLGALQHLNKALDAIQRCPARDCLGDAADELWLSLTSSEEQGHWINLFGRLGVQITAPLLSEITKAGLVAKLSSMFVDFTIFRQPAGSVRFTSFN